MLQASLYCNRHFIIGETDDRLFGSFIEHLGRAIYTGIYEPTHPTADDCGFRQDVLELVRQLRVPVVRYPGGNFVSGYRWEDGTGPATQRPVRAELAWRVLEPNTIGVCEFYNWTKRADTELMMAVNLGTRGVQDACNLLEYCNFPSGTYYSDLRRSHGYEAPLGIRLWCLGNEMDGTWQLGHKDAAEYGKLAGVTARAMKYLDPDISCVVCGSSSFWRDDYGSWEETVLTECYDAVDLISLHDYYGNPEGDTPAYLGCSRKMEDYICSVIAVCDHVKGKLHSEKTMYLSFDEWNVWFHSNEADSEIKPWQFAPRQLEDHYNLEDALVVGCLLITLLRHCDRVKIACLAQLVNAIAPIMTEPEGCAWVQTIFYPFLHASTHGRGRVLRCIIESPVYEAESDAIPFLEGIAVETEAGVTVLAVNRSLEEALELTMTFSEFQLRFDSHTVLTGSDLNAVNSAMRPDCVKPYSASTAEMDGSVLKLSLPPQSWNVILLKNV